MSKRPTRRDVLATGAAIAALALPGVATATIAEADPIFALIEAHKAAWHAEDGACTAQGVAEQRAWSTVAGTPERIEADAALRSAEAAVARASAETDRLAAAMVTTSPPVSVAGALALLRHGDNFGRPSVGSLPEEISVREPGGAHSYPWAALALRVSLPIIEPAISGGRP